MSGMARAAPTMPGRVATFCSCSSERSRWISARRSASAKMRAGTRMSVRALAGISQSVSSIWTSSDIEYHRCPPDVPFLAKVEPVVGDGLDEVRRVAAPALDGCPEAVDGEVEALDALGDERFRLGQEDEL